MARLWNCTALLLIALSAAAAEVAVSFLDAPQKSYLKGSASVESAAEVKDLAAVVTSLLNVPSVSGIDAGISEQVADIVRADPFSRPEAVALINIAGASGALRKTAAARTFTAKNDAAIVSSLVALATARGVEHSLLDVGSLPGCGESCLETMLQGTLEALSLDANYTPGPGVLRGQLAIRTSASSQPVVLDMQRIPDRLFAVELVSTLATVQNLVNDNAQRKAAGVQHPQPQLVKRTLVSLQAVKEGYGSDSLEFTAAAHTMQVLVDAVVAKLQAGFDNRLVVVVSAFDVLPEMSSDVVNMLGGTASIHAFVPMRSLLAAGQLVGDAYSDQFSAWITMWAVFFLLLFFALAGCYCLKNMKFKQDSLLYGKNKSD